MKLLVSTENKIPKDKNGENVRDYWSSISSLEYCQ